jgi:predicted small secreted protein
MLTPTLQTASNKLTAQSIRARAAIIFIAFAATLLTGCGTLRLVDSDVTSFSKWTDAAPKPGTPYRFERLPSQQNAPTQQDELEALARTALAKVGMELNPDAARFSVQVTAVTQMIERPGYGPYDGWGGYGGYGGYGGFGGYGGYGSRGSVFLGGGNRGSSLSIGFGFPIGSPMGFTEFYYRREVAIVMRNLQDQQITFETRALHDGVWRDTLNVLPAMLDSALLGFPEPPAGTRRINVEIPR